MNKKPELRSAKRNYFTCLKFNKGITLFSLVITIIVLLILSGISISMLSGNNSIINKASEAKIMNDYDTIEEALEIYKIKAEGYSKYNIVTDESLVGSLYKKVVVKDTERELGIIVDFKKININPNYGQGGKKLLKEDNDDMNSTKEINTIYELVNIYAVDLSNGNLYFINGNQIFSKTKKVEVAENGTTNLKYEVELVNSIYIEKTKFKTKWNVTLGETEGSSTYSTVVLPVLDGNNIIYNATIDWGDGQTTLLQHRTNGVTLTVNELKEKVTHSYTLGEIDDGIREITISGTYSSFKMEHKNSTSTPSKLKLVEITQWGNVKFTAVNFSGCKNLTGSIPSPNIDGCFTKCTNLDSLFYQCSKLTGNIPSDLFDSAVNCTSVADAFTECSGLEGEIPNLFKNCNKLTCTNKLFLRCSKLTSISEDFVFPDSLTGMYQTFAGTSISEISTTFRLPKYVQNVTGLFESCSLTTIPESFTLPNTVTDVSRMFQNCSALVELPDTFEIPDSVTTMSAMFRQAGKLKKISENFRIPEGTTSIEFIFCGCSSLKKLPDNFTIPSTMKNMSRAFDGCSSLTSLPENFTIPQGVTTLLGTFTGCSGLTSLSPNFSIPNSVTDMGATFARCTSLESLPEKFVIPESVTSGYASYYERSTPGMFGSCKKLKGSLTIKGNITSYTRMFEETSTQSGGTLTVNYSSNCENIDNILETGDSNYVKKGNLVE